MNEIKFRVWDILNKRILNYSDIMQLPMWEVLPGTPEQRAYNVMQYIGLKDKNGKEIYEGDIIKDCENKIMKVIWIRNGFKLEYKFKKTYRGGTYVDTNQNIELRNTNDIRWGIEVIGNIYENPELLEVEQ